MGGWDYLFFFFLYCNNNELYDYVLNRIFGVRENKNWRRARYEWVMIEGVYTYYLALQPY